MFYNQSLLNDSIFLLNIKKKIDENKSFLETSISKRFAYST